MLYEGSLYNNGIYGLSLGGAIEGSVVSLNAYQNNFNNIIFYWSINPFDPSFKNLKWDIEIDRSSNFDSSDKFILNGIDINSSNFIEGINHVGVSINLADIPWLNNNFNDIKIYYRVRGVLSDIVFTPFLSKEYIVSGSRIDYFINLILSNIPDVIINKNPSSNIYKLFMALCLQLGILWRHIRSMEYDYNIDSVRDQEIDRIFGNLCGIFKPVKLNYIDFREILKSFLRNVKMSPSIKSMSNLIYTIFRNYPSFLNIRDEINCFVGNDELYVYEDISPGINSGSFTLDENNYRFGVYVDIEDKRTFADKEVLTDTFIYSIIRKLMQVNANIYIRGI